MRKIPTLFRRDPDDMRRVLPEVTPGCEWVLAGEGVATRKYDGTCVLFELGHWWARREVKPGKTPPEGFRAIETDEVTGKTVGWEPIEQSPFAKFHVEALDWQREFVHESGTYELLGPKINGDPEGCGRHWLIRHLDADRIPLDDEEMTFEGLRGVLTSVDFARTEGIVWHHPDGRMAKLKRRDFYADTGAVGMSAAELRRTRLLADLAAEGAARCCYMPGAANPAVWPNAGCDCKFISPTGPPRGMSEQTGCCEMRMAYRVLGGEPPR